MGEPPPWCRSRHSRSTVGAMAAEGAGGAGVHRDVAALGGGERDLCVYEREKDREGELIFRGGHILR